MKKEFATFSGTVPALYGHYMWRPMIVVRVPRTMAQRRKVLQRMITVA